MARAAQPKQTAQPPSWNILIAEDDLKIRAQLLKAFHHIAHCITVENGEEALKAYQKAIKKKQPFDFILLDVTMPNVNGFQVLKTVRANEENLENSSLKPARIIMITAYKDSLMENYNLGWDEYMTKPVNTEILIIKMKQMMGNC